MFDAVAFGAGGGVGLALGTWCVRRQRRRHASTLVGWGGLALGLGLLIRAAGSLTEDHQPLGVILATCFAVVSVAAPSWWRVAGTRSGTVAAAGSAGSCRRSSRDGVHLQHAG